MTNTQLLRKRAYWASNFWICFIAILDALFLALSVNVNYVWIHCLNPIAMLHDDVRPFWSKEWRFLEYFFSFLSHCAALSTAATAFPPSFSKPTNEIVKLCHVQSLSCFSEGAGGVRRGVAHRVRRARCELCGVARRRHPKVTAPAPHAAARFSALPPHALLVLVHTLANFEFYTWTKKHTISLLQKPVGLDINVHASKKCKIVL